MDDQKQKDLIDALYSGEPKKEPEEEDKIHIVEPGDGSQSKLFKNVGLWSFVGGIVIGLIVVLVMRFLG